MAKGTHTTTQILFIIRNLCQLYVHKYHFIEETYKRNFCQKIRRIIASKYDYIETTKFRLTSHSQSLYKIKNI